MQITLEDYTYIFDDISGRSEVHRHGEFWQDVTGDNLLLAMAHRIQDQEIELIAAIDVIENCGVDYDEVTEHLREVPEDE